MARVRREGRRTLTNATASARPAASTAAGAAAPTESTSASPRRAQAVASASRTVQCTRVTIGSAMLASATAPTCRAAAHRHAPNGAPSARLGAPPDALANARPLSRRDSPQSSAPVSPRSMSASHAA